MGGEGRAADPFVLTARQAIHGWVASEKCALLSNAHAVTRVILVLAPR
jgi:hypothetical protein